MPPNSLQNVLIGILWQPRTAPEFARSFQFLNQEIEVLSTLFATWGTRTGSPSKLSQVLV
jgi:hypothetical protein